MRRCLYGTIGAALLLSLIGCASQPAPAPGPTPLPTATTPAPEPASTPTPTPESSAAAIVADMSVEEQAASVVMGTIASTDPAALHDYMAQGFGGFILMGENIGADAESTRAITDALVIDDELPPLIAIDQEGGDVSRLAWDDAATARTLQQAPVADTESAFQRRSELVAETGANLNFGIIADVPPGPDSFIASRALGTDDDAASDRVAAAVMGEQGTVLSTIKHFPGHGAAPGDSHQSIPATDMSYDDWLAGDAKPFEAGIDAGAEALMFGHLSYTSVDDAPASLSAKWHEIARDELGFDGLMITDDLGMLASSGVDAYADPVRNAVDAIEAGNDMVLMIATSTPDTAGDIADGLVAAVESGDLDAERLRDAAEHVAAARLAAAGQ